MSNTEHRVQKSMLFLCISHREKFMDARLQRHFRGLSSYTSLSQESVSLFLSGHWMFLPQKKKRLFISHVCLPSQDHQETANSGSSARCNIANPDPSLSEDGTKLAVNPTMHCAVPKARQLAETKPFVGLLNPTDGQVDSK